MKKMKQIFGMAALSPLFLGMAFAQTASFTSTGTITIPASGNAAQYPPASGCAGNAACVTVSGLTGPVTNVTLTFNSWNNTSTLASASSLGVLLQAPAAGSNGASAFEVMGNVCKTTGTQTFTLSDAASATAFPGAEPCFGAGGGGTLKPSANHFASFSLDPFSAPGPATYQRAEPDSNPVIGGPSSANTSNGHGTFSYVFNGMTNANGVWRLYVWSAGDAGQGLPGGSIGSWTLTVTTAGAGTSTSTTITSVTPKPSFTSSSLVSLTAQVTPPVGTVNSGNVLFHDNGVAGNNNAGAGDLGTAAVNASGVATLNNVQFAVEGAHRIVATYLGSGSFAASTASPPVTQEVIKTSISQVGAPGGTIGFCSTGSITLPAPGSISNIGVANPYPSSIVVSGQSGLIQGLRVYLNGMTSNAPDFSGYLLAGPNGKTLDFVSNTGGAATISGVNVIFDDAAASQALPVALSFTNTSYKPTAAAALSGDFPYCSTATCNGIVVSQPAPAVVERAAPQGNPAKTLNQQFAGASPNGTWQLFGNMNATATASLTGWCVNFTLGSGTATTTTVSANPNPSTTGSAVTFTATVTGAANLSQGTVTFSDSVSGSNLGTISVANGQAVLSNITNLAEGTHTITAAYNGTASFGFSSGSMSQRVNNPTVQTGNRFCNQLSGISIPATGFVIGASSPYASNVIISTLPGTIQSVEIDLNNYLMSANPNILQMLLVGTCQSASCALDFFSHPPQGSASGPFNLAFSDSGSVIPNSVFSLAAGTYKPFSSNLNTFLSPAPGLTAANEPAPQGSATFGLFTNSDPNGTWSLFPQITTGSANVGSIGSWCVNLAVNKPVLAITKGHSGPGAGNAFVTNQPGTYAIAVTNNGPGSTAGAPVTVSDTMPSGLTINLPVNGGVDWNCAGSTSAAVSCTSTSATAAAQSFSNITVTVTPGLTSGVSVSNSASVSGGTLMTGATSNADVATIIHLPVLGLTNTDNGVPLHTFRQGDTNKTATFTLTNDTAANGAAPTTSQVTVTFTATSGTTVSGIAFPAACAGSGLIYTCASPLPVGFTGNFVVTFNVGASATSPQTIAATVSGGGGNTPSGTDILTINTVAHLVAGKTHTGAFQQGTPATSNSFTISVTNNGPAATSASTTLSDTVDAALPVGTMPAGCVSAGQVVTCTVASGLANGATAGFIIPVAVSGTASGTIPNQVTISGGGGVITTPAANDSVTVAVPPPGLTTVSPNSGQQGQTNLIVALTGQFTHFAQGTSAATFALGITVNSLTVNSLTSATANLGIAGNAGLGVGNVTVTTGGEVVTLTNGFTVLANGNVITFNQPADTALNAGPVTLTATATSLLTVAFASTTPAVCTVPAGGTSATLVSVG